MDKFQLALVPFGAFWASFSALISVAGFVNGIRETVVTGRLGQADLTLPHRRAMLLDWCLAMIATIVAAFSFGGLIAYIAYFLRESHLANANGFVGVVLVVAACPFTMGVLFIICGFSDLRLMRLTLQEEEQRIGSPSVSMVAARQQPAA